ncbi:unnamed protein product [Ranitomeya imitator]|uniref:Large ribosomal subunit protein bL33m n=1 Tax=Ranitomeya imitator TaxID=111125 RepID=A0ABN9KYP1_9NEOB|nr:unnamed protein product [Ranitomeya imitator]
MYSVIILTPINLSFSVLSGRVLLVKMVSAAGTGYSFNTRRNKLKDKLILRKYDPLGNGCSTFCSFRIFFFALAVKQHVLFHEKKKIRSI